MGTPVNEKYDWRKRGWKCFGRVLFWNGIFSIMYFSLNGADRFKLPLIVKYVRSKVISGDDFRPCPWWTLCIYSRITNRQRWSINYFDIVGIYFSSTNIMCNYVLLPFIMGSANSRVASLKSMESRLWEAMENRLAQSTATIFLPSKHEIESACIMHTFSSKSVFLRPITHRLSIFSDPTYFIRRQPSQTWLQMQYREICGVDSCKLYRLLHIGMFVPMHELRAIKWFVQCSSTKSFDLNLSEMNQQGVG